MKNKQKGFTIAELLIVVAIIGVMVAVSIPIFSSKLHKAKVAADWANVRAYYAELQMDYITTGKKNPSINTEWHSDPTYDWTSITHLDGQKVKLKTGTCAVSFKEGEGYSLVYECNKILGGEPECHLSLPMK